MLWRVICDRCEKDISTVAEAKVSDCQHPYLSVAGDGYAVCNSCDQTVYIGDETEPRLTQAGQDELNRQAFGGPEAEARIKAIEREAQGTAEDGAACTT